MEERVVEADTRGLLRKPEKPCKPAEPPKPTKTEEEPKDGAKLGKGAMIVSGD